MSSLHVFKLPYTYTIYLSHNVRLWMQYMAFYVIINCHLITIDIENQARYFPFKNLHSIRYLKIHLDPYVNLQVNC